MNFTYLPTKDREALFQPIFLAPGAKIWFFCLTLIKQSFFGQTSLNRCFLCFICLEVRVVHQGKKLFCAWYRVWENSLPPPHPKKYPPGDNLQTLPPCHSWPRVQIDARGAKKITPWAIGFQPGEPKKFEKPFWAIFWPKELKLDIFCLQWKKQPFMPFWPKPA